MADNNYNVIKPVENLQNVGGLSPVSSNREKRRRPNMKKRQPDQEQQSQLQDSNEEPLTESTVAGDTDKPTGGVIDYCA